MEADVYATEFEREDGGGGEEVHQVFLWFWLTEKFADI
jgi:hypothetical protein